MKKLKFVKSIATATATHNVNDVKDVEDVQAQSFIDAGIAEEVVEKAPKRKAAKSTEAVGE